MEKRITQQIDEKFKTLPKPLQDALLDAHHRGIVLEEIVSKYNLTLGADALDDEIICVIGGLTHPKDFIRKISEGLGIDANKASAVAKEINEKIFRPIRDELTALHTIEKGESSAIPPHKPLSAELGATVGLKPPEPIRPPMPKKPLDAELAESLRKPLPPRTPLNVPQTSAAIPHAPLPPPPDAGSKSFTAQPGSLPPLRTLESDVKAAEAGVSEESSALSHSEPLPTPPLPTPTPARRPIPSFTPPPPPKTGHRVQGEGDSKDKDTPSPYPLNPTPSSTPSPTTPAPTQTTTWERQAPKWVAPPVLKKDTSAATPREQESEENLNREEILRGIENPESISPPSSVRSKSPAQYNQDPYREPIE